MHPAPWQGRPAKGGVHRRRCQALPDRRGRVPFLLGSLVKECEAAVTRELNSCRALAAVLCCSRTFTRIAEWHLVPLLPATVYLFHCRHIQSQLADRDGARLAAAHTRCWCVLFFPPFLFLSLSLLSTTSTCWWWLLLLCFGFRLERARFAEHAEASQDDRLPGFHPAEAGVLLGARRAACA